MLGKKFLGHVASLVFVFVLVVGLIPAFTPPPAAAAAGAGSAGAGAAAGVITPDGADDLEGTVTPVLPDDALDGERPANRPPAFSGGDEPATPSVADEGASSDAPVAKSPSVLPFANTSLLAATGALASVSVNGAPSTAYATLPEIVAVINTAWATDSISVNFLRDCPDVSTTAAISTKAQVVMRSDPAAMAANANTPFVIKRLVTSAASLFTIATTSANNTVTFTNITLDGGCVWTGPVDPALGRPAGIPANVAAKPLSLVIAQGRVSLAAGATIQNVYSKGTDVANTNSGALLISEGGAGRLEGGVIRNCTSADHGAAVSILGTPATFEMHAGAVYGNMSAFGGGAIFHQGNVCIIAGGVIRNNKAPGGSAIMATRNLDMRGGEVRHNYTTSDMASGAIVLSSTARYNFIGGSVCNNAAASPTFPAGISWWGGSPDSTVSLGPDFSCFGNKAGSSLQGETITGGTERNFSAGSDTFLFTPSGVLTTSGSLPETQGAVGVFTYNKTAVAGQRISKSVESDALYNHYMARYVGRGKTFTCDTNSDLLARPVYESGSSGAWYLEWAKRASVRVKTQAEGPFFFETLAEGITKANTLGADVAVECLVPELFTTLARYDIVNAAGKTTTITTGAEMLAAGKRAKITQKLARGSGASSGLFAATTPLVFSGIDFDGQGASLQGGNVFYATGAAGSIKLADTVVSKVSTNEGAHGDHRAIVALNSGARGLLGSGCEITGNFVAPSSANFSNVVLASGGCTTTIESTAKIVKNNPSMGIYASTGNNNTLNMTGGDISENLCAGSHGEGVCGGLFISGCDSGAINFLGGAVYNNKVTGHAVAAVYSTHSTNPAMKITLGGSFDFYGNTNKSGATIGIAVNPASSHALAAASTSPHVVYMAGYKTMQNADDATHLAPGKTMFTCKNEAEARASEKLADGGYRFQTLDGSLVGSATNTAGTWAIVWKPAPSSAYMTITKTLDKPSEQDTMFWIKLTNTATGAVYYQPLVVFAGQTRAQVIVDVAPRTSYTVADTTTGSTWRYGLAPAQSVTTGAIESAQTLSLAPNLTRPLPGLFAHAGSC
ncbi:MAG: hypothetical protein RR917_03375 [Eggerthellaceae bacterium]